jgi:DNA-binding CsgD family transcriptional regulator
MDQSERSRQDAATGAEPTSAAETSPPSTIETSPRSTTSVRLAMEDIRATQGRARQFWHVFENSRVPMTMADNNRQHLAANTPTRLLFRLSEAQILERRIDDLTPPHRLAHLYERWDALMTRGSVAGPYEAVFPDGGELRIVYCALANALPGQHLIVFAPADWPVSALVDHAGEPAEPLTRSLTRREREVLSLIAAGADRQEIADELTISVATVRTHVRNVLRKLGARNRAHAIALAVQHGLIQLPSSLPGSHPA